MVDEKNINSLSPEELSQLAKEATNEVVGFLIWALHTPFIKPFKVKEEKEETINEFYKKLQ